MNRGNNHGPPILRELSDRISKRLTAWQTVVVTLLWLYISRNFAKIWGLECPEPLANLYSRAYFRATWVTTALDAGFWTAMKIRKKWIRDLASIAFSIYYLIAAEQADEKVRKVRGSLTVDHLRVSWNKGTTPYLSFLTGLVRPKFSRYAPRKIRIPRPPDSSYEEPVVAWLYYDAPFATIKQHRNIILDIPGGGFVAMDPRTNDDKLLAWSGKTGLPIVSLDYRKAPEYPYPYALNECFDVYTTLVASSGRCIGLSGEVTPRIVISGDSAGGNLATSTTLMIIQSGGVGQKRRRDALPLPEGLILIYPGLDMNIGSWMTDEQMALIQDRRTRKRNRNVLRRKSEDYYKLDPSTPHQSEDEGDQPSPVSKQMFKSSLLVDEPEDVSNSQVGHTGEAAGVSARQAEVAEGKPQIMKTRLAMCSMISYFNDRVLTPEMMRAMIILYVGPHNRPDFTTDYLLSPLLAPEAMLAQFPKTYFLTGERDPLVDDTVIFAGRLRQAKYNQWVQRRELGLKTRSRFDEADYVSVALIPGISHGFFQFVGVFPEGWKHIFRCARWMEEIFELDPRRPVQDMDGAIDDQQSRRERHHARKPTDSSGDEDRPLEMTAIRGGGASKGKARRGEARRVGGASKAFTAKRQKSSVSLASEDDLLGRRMQGLAGGLMGLTGKEDV